MDVNSCAHPYLTILLLLLSRPQDVNASISLDQAFQHLATAQVLLQRLTDVDGSGQHYAIQG
jgi:hypothetical protein